MKYDVQGPPRPGSYLPWSRHDTLVEAEAELAARPGPGRIVCVPPIHPAGYELRTSYLAKWFATYQAAEEAQRAYGYWAGSWIRAVGATYPHVPLDIEPSPGTPMARHFAALVAESEARSEEERWRNS